MAYSQGNAFALTNDPTLPIMFIAAETLPEFFPAMSVQNAQLGLMVISAPNAAATNPITATSGESAPVTTISPAADSVKPAIAGSARDQLRNRET